MHCFCTAVSSSQRRLLGTPCLPALSSVMEQVVCFTSQLDYVRLSSLTPWRCPAPNQMIYHSLWWGNGLESGSLLSYMPCRTDFLEDLGRPPSLGPDLQTYWWHLITACHCFCSRRKHLLLVSVMWGITENEQGVWLEPCRGSQTGIIREQGDGKVYQRNISTFCPRST